MEWSLAKARFSFLANAFDGTGGFAPQVFWYTEAVDGTSDLLLKPSLTGPTELVRYPRESAVKFAARNAVAVYENHLRSACERFVGFLGRRRPQREGLDAPLAKLFAENCDLRGGNLDKFWRTFALNAKARGSMLLVMDIPEGPPATSLADQIERRRVPYVRAAFPEAVKSYRLDADSGLLLSITLSCWEWIDDRRVQVDREYTTVGWRVLEGERVLREGAHGFGACPVLAFTESGDDFPVVGKYAQIADLSRRIFNARSELDEILRGQTFSVLALNVPADQAALFNAASVSATIGTHSMLVYAGANAPAFISPDSGPAEVYGKKIEELQQAIRRVSMDESTESSAQAESGLSRRLRFEALNADIATFAQGLQQLEARMWELFRRAVGGSPVNTAWPTDYNLADVVAELDILTMMQTTGFPPRVLNEKRRAIVATEFDNADEETKGELSDALDELDQAEAEAPDTTPDPNNPQE